MVFNMKSLQLTKPHCLIVIGIPGSGKTTFAERFAETFSAPYLNAQKLQGSNAKTIASELLDEFLKTKQTLMYEVVDGTKVERTTVAKQARNHGYEPLYVWIQTDPSTAKQRVTRASKTQPSAMTEEQFEAAKNRFTAPSAHEKAVVLSGKHTYASQAKAVLRRLSADNPRPNATDVPARSIPGRRVSIQ